MRTYNAYAKINWSLAVCETRPDGYHGLDMLMQRISLCDTLTFEQSDTLSLTVNGVPCASDSDDLVLKAARALNAYTHRSNGVHISLEKRIPARAGLGGGSADCACALLALNERWSLGLDRGTLEAIGLRLGADVPFCVRERFCRARGLGEILDPLPGTPDYYLVMITPGGGLSTPAVFKAWNTGGHPSTPIDTLALADALIKGDLITADRIAHNDLQAPAVELMPEIADLITRFRSLGSPFVRMTGSGSTVFATFIDEASAVSAASAVPGSIVVRTLNTIQAS